MQLYTFSKTNYLMFAEIIRFNFLLGQKELHQMQLFILYNYCDVNIDNIFISPIFNLNEYKCHFHASLTL